MNKKEVSDLGGGNTQEKSAATTGILAAVAASSCCIPPVIAALAGIGGMSSRLSWMEPFRPYFIGLAVVAIGYAWYAHLKPKSADDCACKTNENPKWYQTKGFLITITLFAALSIAFPYYSGIFFSDNNTRKTIIVNASDLAEESLRIEGMTCLSCEHRVNQALNNTEGVIDASSSFETGLAVVQFDKTKVTVDQLAKAVEKETGYNVLDQK